MATATLPREALSIEPEQQEISRLIESADTLDDGLADTCADRLGYGVLKQELHNQRIKNTNRRSALYRVMALKKAMIELGITPLSASHVKQYKIDMVKKFTPLSPLSSEAMWAIFSCVGFGFLFVISCLTEKVPAGVLLLSLVIAVGLVIVWMNNDTSRYQGRGYVPPSWKKFLIKDYPRRVPEFALQTAADLSEKCPEAQFYIDELQLEEKPPDPFLLVQVDHATYYLEVWNEPGFVQKREH